MQRLSSFSLSKRRSFGIPLNVQQLFSRCPCFSHTGHGLGLAPFFFTVFTPDTCRADADAVLCVSVRISPVYTSERSRRSISVFKNSIKKSRSASIRGCPSPSWTPTRCFPSPPPPPVMVFSPPPWPTPIVGLMAAERAPAV